MSDHTKTRPTRTRRRLVKTPKVANRKRSSTEKETFISWRKALAAHLEEHGEGAVLLRGSRYKADMSQKELADAIGVKQHHISEMENGKRAIGKEIAQRLGKFFSIDYRVFL